MSSRESIAEDARFMRLAIEEAKKGAPSPNPHVGAVVVDEEGAVVGRGFHLRPGRDHGEVAALKDAAGRARGSTLYVTLEPCNHHGRTPPCTDAILEAGIHRVVVGARDPNPHVTGRGNERLREAGVVVDEIASEPERAACAELIAPFAKHVRTGRPYVRVKLASSIDGRIATATRVSQWITSEGARHRVHAMRAAADAVAIGVGTALADDPRLTPRHVPAIEGRDLPARVVFDADVRLPPTSRLVETIDRAPLFVVAAHDGPSADALTKKGAKILRVARAPAGKGVDLDAGLAALGSIGVVDLLVEGGATLVGGLVARDLVDELVFHLAPIVLGDAGLASIVGPRPESPDAAPRYVVASTTTIDGDVAITLRRRAPHTPPSSTVHA